MSYHSHYIVCVGCEIKCTPNQKVCTRIWVDTCWWFPIVSNCVGGMGDDKVWYLFQKRIQNFIYVMLLFLVRKLCILGVSVVEVILDQPYKKLF